MDRFRDLMRTRSSVVLGAVTLVIAVLAITTYSQAAPYVGFLDLVRLGLPGLAFAAGSVAVALIGRGRAGAVLLAVSAVAASAGLLSVGLQQRTGGWVLVAALSALLAPAVVVLALAFPDGRLDRRDRAAAAVVGLVGVASALALAGSYDPATWGWCRCVANPLGQVGAPDAYLDLVDAVAVGRMLVLAAGLTLLSVPWRHRHGVPLAFAATYAVLAATWMTADVLALTGASVPTLLELGGEAALVLLPVLYTIGFATRRPSRARVADLLVAAREEQDPARLRDLVARAIGDPRAGLAWWDTREARYLDHQGRPVEPVPGEVIAVETSGRPVAVVLSRHAAEVEPGVRDSVAQALLLAAENRRLTAELQASLEEVRESRTRILTASDDTRRRIERDLHDGAQQLLISTGIKLNLAAVQAQHGDAETLAQVLEEAQAELNRALGEIRSLASGIAPTALVHGNLDNALHELALRSPVPTTVRVTGDDQPPEHTAATVYFVVAECLANVAKHARATRAGVEVTLGEPVGIRVTDDGVGGATLDTEGTGLRGLADRVEAHGGRLELRSGPGGTTVEAAVPTGVTERLER